MDGVLCPVCRNALGETAAVCTKCETPHHPDCWEFGGGCAVFACGGERSRTIETATLAPGPQPELVLDDTLEEPAMLILEEAMSRRSHRRHESAAVLAVSWLYMAASLAVVIPAAGCFLVGLAGLNTAALFPGGVLSFIALALKGEGDLIAAGEPAGRKIHLGLCAVAAVALIDSLPPFLPILIALPFLGPRADAHFGSDASR